MNEQSEEHALQLLQNTQIIILTAVGENGYPRPSVMTKLANKGLRKFYFVAGKSSNKVAIFAQNSKAGLCYYAPGGSVTLMGDVHAVTDKSLLQTFWHERLCRSFPQGVDDPNFCILCFTATEATLCFEGNVEHHSFAN